MLLNIHATRAFLPPHLSCIMNFVNELLLVWYIGSHRKKLWNQTLENFWENTNLIFLMQKLISTNNYYLAIFWEP